MKIKGKISQGDDYHLVLESKTKLDALDFIGEPATLIVKGTASDRICKCGIREDLHDEMETITHDFDPASNEKT